MTDLVNFVGLVRERGDRRGGAPDPGGTRAREAAQDSHRQLQRYPGGAQSLPFHPPAQLL